MKVRTAILAFACIGLLSTVSYGAGAGTPTDPMGGPGGAPPSQGQGGAPPSSQAPGMGGEALAIQGEITRVQDDIYVVKDASGREVALHVDQSTQKSGEFQEGDKIKAQVTADGHALSLEKDDQSSIQ